MDTRNFSDYVGVKTLVEEISEYTICKTIDNNIVLYLIFNGVRFGYFSYHLEFPPKNLEDVIQWFDSIDNFIQWFNHLDKNSAEEKLLNEVLSKPNIICYNGKYIFNI